MVAVVLQFEQAPPLERLLLSSLLIDGNCGSEWKLHNNQNFKDRLKCFFLETFKVKMGRVQEWWLVTRSEVKGLCVRNFQETEIA